MAFTSKLGTADSQLGNIELGAEGATSGNYDDTLTIAGTSAFAAVPASIWESSVAVAGTSAVSLLEGFRYQLTKSLDVTCDFVGLDGFRYQLTKSLDATAACAVVDSLGVSNSLTIAGTANIAEAFDYFQSNLLTIAGTSAVAVSFTYFVNTVLTVSGTAAFTSPGGVAYSIQRSIEGTSSIAVLDGFLYQKAFSIDGTASIAVSEIYLMQELISLATEADVTVTETGFIARNALTIAGTSAIALTTDGAWLESITLSGTSRIFIENIYDVLLVSAVLCSFAATVTKTAPGTEIAASVGTFSASASCVFNRPVTQAFTMTQTLVLKKPTWQASHTLTMTQTAVCQKIHVETVTQTLSLTQTAYAARAVSHTLTFSQTATCIRVQNRTVTQSLILTQTVARRILLRRTTVQTLVFDPPNLQKLPIIGSQSQTGNKQFDYYVPNVYPVLVPKKCLIILGVPSQVILLPCPIFGDSQSYQGEINLKRAMTGVTYTYVKKVKTQKLHYSFELWTKKYLELRQFFIDHAEELMTLQNHNAETWWVQLVNNPIEFTTESRWQPRGEKYNVTLEFEGVKIGG